MRVFQGLSTSNHETTLVNAMRAIVSNLNKLTAPRSLCEIHMDEEDYDWLCRWALQLVPGRVQRGLDGLYSRSIALQVGGDNYTHAEAIGSMFLLLASETGRREASEGSLWSAVRRQVPHSVERILFLQGQPREMLKDAMEVSARKLELRHVYGQDGTHEYYLSVYLQFGFTWKGLARLAHWLAGQGTSESVQHLTGGRIASLRSASFLELWNGLRDFRKNNITEERTRALLAASPWILPDWTDELLKQARERLELGTAESGRTAAEEQAPPQFLSSPRLRWDLQSAPEFVCDIVNLADFGLTSDLYLIKSGSKVLARLLMNSSGGYVIDPEDVIMPADQPERVATIVDHTGDSPGSQVMMLWDPMEEVELFDLSTGKISNGSDDVQLVTGREYGLMVSDDLEIEPPDMPFHQVGGGDCAKRLYLVRGDVGRPVRVKMDGEEIWKSGERAIVRDRPIEPSWASPVKIQFLPSNKIDLASPSRLRLSISGLDKETLVTHIRTAARPLDFVTLEDGTCTSSEFDILSILSPKTTTPTLDVKIGLLHDDHRVTILRSLVPSVQGVLRMTAEGWQTVRPDEPMSAYDAKQYTYRILPPRSDRTDLALMESSVFLRRLWTIPRPFETLGGYGASLAVRSPYNWVHVDDLLTVSYEIHDPGVVDAAIAYRKGVIRLCLNQPLEPGELHDLVFWTPGIPPIVSSARQSVTQSDHESDIWDVTCPSSFVDKEGFVAISYDGARIGACWPAAPYRILGIDGASAHETAAMLRWMHAPIVSRAWFGTVRGFAARYPGHVLKAWLDEEELPYGLRHGTIGEQWRSAIRQTFSEWTPDIRSAVSVLRVLGEGSGITNDHMVYQALWKLLRLNPVLMGRVLRTLNREPNMSRIVQVMRLQIAELPPGSTSRAIADREEELLRQVSTQMGSDPGFLDRGIVHKVLNAVDYSNLSTVDRNNAEVALNVAPFREYLGLKVLSALVN